MKRFRSISWILAPNLLRAWFSCQRNCHDQCVTFSLQQEQVGALIAVNEVMVILVAKAEDSLKPGLKQIAVERRDKGIEGKR